MITIRGEQVDAFLFLDGGEGLISLIVAHLHHESLPLVERIPPDLLPEMVRSGIARARARHGLASAADLVAFVSLMFEIAPNFDAHPAIQAALADSAALGGERIDRLVRAVPETAWSEAEAGYDERAWFAL